MIYLDSAATSLLKPSAVGYAMADALRSMASPGRGGHAPSMLAADTVFRCREKAAERLAPILPLFFGALGLTAVGLLLDVLLRVVMAGEVPNEREALLAWLAGHT